MSKTDVDAGIVSGINLPGLKATAQYSPVTLGHGKRHSRGPSLADWSAPWNLSFCPDSRAHAKDAVTTGGIPAGISIGGLLQPPRQWQKLPVRG